MTVTHRILPRAFPVGGFDVRRLLPAAECRKVGPWVFVDHFGPATLTPDQPLDVAPHPHCGLSTVSYLFEGVIEHRDSTGGHGQVHPGEIHWMRAGHGVVHSERTPAHLRGHSQRIHGLQLWCAHPDGEEEQEPRYDAWTDLPVLDVGGVRVRLLAGHGWGEVSPVAVTSPLVYAVATLAAGQSLALPEHVERCVYPLSGRVEVDGEPGAAHELLVVDGHARAVRARSDAVVSLLGGDPVGPRHLWWNLVHSDPHRLREQAERWRAGGFPALPGDDGPPAPTPPGP